MKGNKGFTIVELIIVVAIIGILLVIVIPNIGDFGCSCIESGNQTQTNNVREV